MTTTKGDYHELSDSVKILALRIFGMTKMQ
jgi:hypothetical protein